MKAILALLGGTAGLVFVGIILAVALISLCVFGIFIFIFVKILKDKNNGTAQNDNTNDTFMRMHNNFMDDSRRAHEMHMNMNNNMFH